MKKLILLSELLVIGLLSFSQPVFSQSLNDICSPSLQFVYAVGNNGTFMKSTNGGTNYSSALITVENLNGVFSVGNAIWVVGDAGRYLSSNDLGLTWNSSTLGSGSKLNSVYFADSLTGFISGDGGVLFRSLNGGANWSPLTSGYTFSLTDMKFVSVMTGYAWGNSNSILKTTNGGENWSLLSTPSLSFIRALDVSGNEMIAGSSENILYRSTDLGVSWLQIPLKVVSMPGINALTIISPSRYTVILESGSIWNTSNGGANFTFPQNEFMDELNSVSLQGQRIYASSKRHRMIVRSLNSGASWSLTPNSTYSISFVSLLGGNFNNFNRILNMNYQKRGVLYALERDKIYRTLNYGGNWSVISTIPVDSTTYCSTQLLVNTKDSSKMLAAVNSLSQIGGEYRCRIYRTTDYGINWSRVLNLNIDYIGNFMNLDSQHPDTVYLGAKDTVFKTTNWGANWSKICEAPFEDWCDVVVHSSNSQIVYGSTNHYPAKLQKSTNGGINWSYVDFVLDTAYSEMPAIATTNLSPNVLLHAQYTGVNSYTGLKRSYTSGNSWLFNQLPGTSWAIDISKDDPNLYAYGSVSYDPVFLSTNSGGVFAGTSNSYAEQILYYDRANLYINNHGYIYKMRIVYNMPVIGIENISSEIPVSFSVSQNYPNPFNPVTNIQFSIPKLTDVKLIVYDALGREVKLLVDQQLNPGKYNVDWNAAGQPSGVYFYKISAGNFSVTKKMILIR
jgi:photosystem II stability/assembly factor-like uncharacterized protein